MDFFEQQDRARRRTAALIGYFVLAVWLIIAAVYGIFTLVFIWLARPGDPAVAPPVNWWQPELLAWVAAGTLLVVLGGALYKIATLSHGGEAVARMLGARRLPPGAPGHDQRRLLNVVEEIAIASGVPVPAVFVLEDEAGINAFAAGFTPNDAVIGVTRGAMTLLSRDELQGVIAHEFSHILNGDMRLNLRLMGVLHGILVIALIGYLIFRAAVYGRRSGGNRKQGGGVLLVLVLGLGLMAIGYIGVFFAKLIKSAVSRQREFLADAAAAQFTRYPAGLAGALKKIGGFDSGSRLASPRAEEASHLFFANGLSASFLNLLATHPPLAERIRRLDPSFDGVYPPVNRLTPMARQVANAGRPAPAPAAVSRAAPPLPLRRQVRAGELSREVGRPGAGHLAYAAAILAALPAGLRDSARDAEGARALIYGLVLGGAPEVRARGLEHLRQNGEAAMLERLAARLPELDALGAEFRLPLADLALSALRGLTREQFAIFKANLDWLVAADRTITLFEYALQRGVVRHLEKIFDPRVPEPVKYYALKPLAPALTTLLSTLAYYGQDDSAAAAAAFRAGAAELRLDLQLLPRDQCGLQPADRAIGVLQGASPQIKKILLAAAAASVAADGRVTVNEAELLRALADALVCPLPPLLAAA